MNMISINLTRLVVLFFLGVITGCANLQAVDEKKTYSLDFGDQLFSMDVGKKPEDEYIRFKTIIPYKDESFFVGEPDVGVLRLAWFYKSWPFDLPNGMATMYVSVTKAGCNTENVACLEKNIERLANLFLTKELNRAEEKINYTEVVISGRKWLKYKYPLHGAYSYSTFISKDKYFSVHLDYLNNASAGGWLYDAGMQLEQTIQSMRFIDK